jgi:preprotein translocase subunit YajC
MLISTAYAQGAGGGGAGGLEAFLPLILIFVVFYFLLIRPQQKKMKQHKAMLAAIKRGDQIVTGGGVYGKVHKVGDDGVLQVDIADGVRVRVAQDTVATVIDKTQPVSNAANQNEKKGGLFGGLFGGGGDQQQTKPSANGEPAADEAKGGSETETKPEAESKAETKKD